MKHQVFTAASALIVASISWGQISFPDAVPGEYVVLLKSGVQKNQILNFSSQVNSSIVSYLPSQNLLVVKRASFESPASAIAALKQSSLVKLVEPNYIYRISKLSNDPMLEQTWGLRNIGQKDSKGSVGVAGVDVGAEQAWDITTGNPEMLVAVIDTGIDFTHPDLVANLWVNEAEKNGTEGVDDDNNGVVDDIHGFNAITGKGDANDDQGHGSHCAGTIGASGDNGIGVAGVNWNVKLMAVKFLDRNGSGNLANAVKAIDYATKMGAKVMSNSWGGGPFSQILFDSIQRSSDAGALFVAAAGNDNNNNDVRPTYPSSMNTPNMISVAAIDNKGARASFSSFGRKSVHLGAPGVNVVSTTGGDYKSFSGTSMATPHVAGVAALVWGYEPNLTALEVKERLLKTVVLAPSMKNRTQTGGIVNAYNALTKQETKPDANDPANWASIEAAYSSASPYLKNTNEDYEIKAPGANEFAIYFEKFDTEAGYDLVKLIDANGVVLQTLSGNNDDTYSVIVKGDSVKLNFKSDDTQQKSGWKITKIAIR